MVAESNDEQLALARLRAWKDAGATLLFSFSGYSTNPFSLRVSIRGVDEPNSALVLDWLLFAIAPDTSTQPFIATDGRFVVRFAGATFTLSENPSKSVSIVRHPFSCVLTELRASAFQTV